MTLFVNNGKTATELPDSGGDPIPTSTSWGANTEVLAATKTLVDASETLQFLDPNGADRDVACPVLTSDTPFFLIHNMALGADESVLTVKNNAGEIIGTVPPRAQTWVVNDGTSFTMNKFTDVVTSRAAQYLQFSGLMGTLGFLQPNGEANVANTTVERNYTKNLVMLGGVIDSIVFHRVAGGGGTLAEWFINEASQGELTFTGETGVLTFDLPVPVKPGDQISVKDLDGSNSGTGLGFVVRSGVAAAVVQLGADITGGTQRYLVGEDGGTASNGTGDNQNTELVMPAAGTVSRLGFIGEQGSLVTTSSQINIRKNGSFVQAITLTNLNQTTAWATDQFAAIQAASVSFVEGDRLSFEYDNGGTPGSSMVFLLLEGVEGTLYPFGGDPSGAQFMSTHGQSGDAGLPTGVVDARTQFAVREAGTAVRLTRRGNLVGSGNYDVYKNGALSESTTFGGGVALSNTISTVLAVGDRLAIRAAAGGDANYLVQVK